MEIKISDQWVLRLNSEEKACLIFKIVIIMVLTESLINILLSLLRKIFTLGRVIKSDIQFSSHASTRVNKMLRMIVICRSGQFGSEL